MKTRKAKILVGDPDVVSSIEIGGRPLNGVTFLELTAGAGSLPRLTIDLLVTEVEIEGDVRVEVDPRARESLIAIGWTPPADDGE